MKSLGWTKGTTNPSPCFLLLFLLSFSSLSNASIYIYIELGSKSHPCNFNKVTLNLVHWFYKNPTTSNYSLNGSRAFAHSLSPCGHSFSLTALYCVFSSSFATWIRPYPASSRLSHLFLLHSWLLLLLENGVEKRTTNPLTFHSF